ncbi:MAG: TlpA disulfide reductase family protein [Bacteroides sp.]|nr:TlpA disulfide reductase family protein [Bacteroides sp.]
MKKIYSSIESPALSSTKGGKAGKAQRLSFGFSRILYSLLHGVERRDASFAYRHTAFPKFGKICLVCFFLGLLSACGSKKSEAVSLSGEIKGLGNDTIYIYGTDRLYDRMDTLVVEGDKFSTTLSVDTLVSTWLLFSDGTEYPLYLDKGNTIQIKGSAADLAALDITGNTPNAEFSAYQKSLKGLAKPSELALEEKAKTFIKEHPSSLVSIYLLAKYFVQKPQPDMTRIEQLIGYMAGELKDRVYIDNLLDCIAEEEKARVGKSGFNFKLPNAAGENINRTDYRNKYLLLHFWASWDSLSREQNAVYRRLYKKEKDNEHFAMLGVSLDIDRPTWLQTIEQDTLKWEQVCDLEGWNADIVKLFALHTLPANVLLTPAGKIDGKNLDEEAIKKKLKDIDEQEKRKEREKTDRSKKKKR